MSGERLTIRGAREHNLRNIDLELPRERIVVITGLSGSGKSSLAFDTIYAEGQRRYVESLSAYARQFLGLMEKPDVDSIEGLSPAISIEQKTVNRNPRSTVGTVTEVYDYLRLLWARAGIPHCAECGQPVLRQSATQIVDQLLERQGGRHIEVLAPLVRGRKGQFRELFERARRTGFVRARVDGEVHELSSPPALNRYENHDIAIVVDAMPTAAASPIRSRRHSPPPTAWWRCESVARRRPGSSASTTLVWGAAPVCRNSNRASFPSTLPTAHARSAAGWVRAGKSIPNS